MFSAPKFFMLYLSLLIIFAGCSSKPDPKSGPSAQHPFSGQLPHPSYMDALEQMRKKDGRDNAFTHYGLASWAMPNMQDINDRQETIKAILTQGWGPEAEAMKAAIDNRQSTFAEIRKGAALDYAKGIGLGDGVNSMVPNFLATQMAAKMMCVEGRYFENQNEFTKALDNYLTVLTMGRDYCTPDNALISYLIGIAVETIALNQVHHLVVSGKLDKPNLRRAFDRLKHIEKTHGSVDTILEAERLVHQALRTQGQNVEEPDFSDAKTRTIVMMSKLLQTQLAAAAELAKLDKGRYPESLETLPSTYFSNLPIDPFAGKPFIYRATPDGKRYFVYGIGPDQQDQSGRMIYDAKNGTKSLGDIVMMP